jgi:hypothetical protein
MIKLNLTDQDQSLMRRVCELQLDSFQRILSSDQESSIKEKLIEYHISENELNNMIMGVAKKYRDIQLTPGSLFHAHADLINNFREALDFNTEYLSDFSGLIPSLLRRLDLAKYVLENKN